MSLRFAWKRHISFLIVLVFRIRAKPIYNTCAQQSTIIRFQNEIEYFSLIQDNIVNIGFATYIMFIRILLLSICSQYKYKLFGIFRIAVQFTDKRDEEEQNKPKQFFHNSKKSELKKSHDIWYLEHSSHAITMKFLEIVIEMHNGRE